ncbi:MAG: rRNA maturation RNase YbeY [Lentisphaerae bacterium]|nr:rRNA maturation RNase YbeY [Lentisphaerota bacterium]
MTPSGRDRVNIEIRTLQRGFRIDRRLLRSLAAALAGAARRVAPQAPWRELTVLLADDAAIDPINRIVMGHAGATDVITQRYEAVPGEPPGLVGELVINVEQAWRVGAHLARTRSAWSPAHELALYLAHGCDHLAGADDDTPAGRIRMRRRERRWLAGLEIPASLIRPAPGGS